MTLTQGFQGFDMEGQLQAKEEAAEAGQQPRVSWPFWFWATFRECNPYGQRVQKRKRLQFPTVELHLSFLISADCWSWVLVNLNGKCSCKMCQGEALCG